VGLRNFSRPRIRTIVVIVGYAKKLFPELGLLRFLVIPFQVAYFLIKVITWPIRAPLTAVTRAQDAAFEQQQLGAAITRDQHIAASLEAIERENQDRRADGVYVPALGDGQIVGVCGTVTIVYGHAYQMSLHGIPVDWLMATFDAVEAKLGGLTPRAFGVDPRSALGVDHNDFTNCVAVAAFFLISTSLRDFLIFDNTPGITGVEAPQGIGAFSRAIGVDPGLTFADQRAYDCYYVAKNFIPTPSSAESGYLQYCTVNERYSTEYFKVMGHEAKLPIPFNSERSGTFGPELTWLNERLFQRHGPLPRITEY
jgi:hypothetical protein